jgi:hypothetical protein
MDYLVPTASEAPDIEIAHLVSPSPLTPLGSKGLGESSSMTVPAVIANAVSDALAPLGIRITDLPMTPSRLWHLIQRARPGMPEPPAPEAAPGMTEPLRPGVTEPLRPGTTDPLRPGVSEPPAPEAAHPRCYPTSRTPLQ